MVLQSGVGITKRGNFHYKLRQLLRSLVVQVIATGFELTTSLFKWLNEEQFWLNN